MFGFGSSKSSSRSSSQSSGRTFLDPGQAPFLDFLRNQGQQLAVGQMQNIGGVADQLSGALGGVGNNLLSILSGQAGGGQALPGMSSLQAIAQGGQNQLDFGNLLQPGAQMEGQLSALDAAIQRNLGSTLGTLGQSASLAGQSGGDREAFFARQAAGDATRAFASGASDLMAQDLASRRGLAGVAAQMQGQQNAQQLAAAQAMMQGGLQGQAQQQNAALGGIGALSGLFNLGMSPFQAAFSPLLNFGQLVGAPTVLSQQQSSSKSRSKGESTNMSWFGGGGGD